MRIVNPENEPTAAKKSNTGKQIQSIADLICGLSWLAIFIGGMVFFVADNLIVGGIVIAVGFYASWAGTRVLQGFGELVEDTAANRANTDRILSVLNSIRKNQQIEQAAKQKQPEA